MSFKLKTILLLIGLSLTPYVITMMFIGSSYRDDIEVGLRENLSSYLSVTIDRLDQHVLTLQREIRLISSLDIMNDILTDDFDRRISNLLQVQKREMQLHGDFDVLNAKDITIASSDMNNVGTLFAGDSFMSKPIVSTFDQQEVGMFILRYRIEELERFFHNEESLRYSLRRTTAKEKYRPIFDISLIERGQLTTMPNVEVIIEQNKAVAFLALDKSTTYFYIAALIGTFLIALIAYLMANYIVNPILLLSSTAKSITKTQDYSKRVDVNRRDEIGQLSQAFNLMIHGMQNMIDQLKEESENKLKLMQEYNRAEMLQDLSNKLSKYLSPQIYQLIFSGDKDVTLSSSRKKLTVFFSDIVDFTATTDHMESEDLTHILNQYLNEMTNIALHYGATVDKYIGDAVMIFFGDPNTLGPEQDAVQCIKMSLDMKNKVSMLQTEWRSLGFSKPFHVRFGMHTGYCTVGNFGSENRMDYTIIGSTVNLASRIESCAEPGSIFISEDTYLLVKNHFHCVQATTVTPKGFSHPVQLYKVLDEITDQHNKAQPITIESSGFMIKYEPDELNEEEKMSLKAQLKLLIQDLNSKLP